MGNCIRSVLRRLRTKRCSEKTIILLIVGLDNAGKTTVLNCISGDTDRNVLPTMGFRTISLKHKSYLVNIYDIGGSSQIRALWTKYYAGIHGLIYVVDASDISRLTENKVVFGELVSHEHISGKPLLLLANKQDISGAIDELDLVENLDVESAANNTRCPTRVETCSCVCESEQSRDSTIGIRNGYKWLLDTVAKNYIALNSRIKDSHNLQNERIPEVQTIVPDTPSRLSVHSNPFKPIKELISKKEDMNAASSAINGIAGGKKLKKIFTSRNKTVPFSPEQSAIEIEDVPEYPKTTVIVGVQRSTRTISPILSPLTLENNMHESRSKPSRPYTAPERSSDFVNKVTIINIPGQVMQ